MFAKFLLFFLIAQPLLPLMGDDKVTISRALDANLFLSTASDTFRLANIETYSIHDSRPLYSKYAARVFNYSSGLEGKTYDVAYKTTGPVPGLLLMYEQGKRRSRSRLVNKIYLLRGYGFFEEEPQTPHFAELEKSAREARIANMGVHNKLRFIPYWQRHNTSLWLNAGIGGGNSGGPGGMTQLAGGLNLSYRRFLAKFEVQLPFRMENYEYTIRNYYLGFLVSQGRFHHLSLSAGGGPLEYYWGYYGNEGHVYKGMCGAIQLQSFLHFPAAFGVGVNLDANFNKKRSFYAISLQMVLGVWN